MKSFYMVSVKTRFAVMADNAIDALEKIKNGKGREFDVRYGTEVHVIHPDSVYTHGLEDMKDDE